MIDIISQALQKVITNLSFSDNILFKNKKLPLTQDSFKSVNLSDSSLNSHKSITYIDGGQALILSASNFALSFIRVAGVTFKGEEKTSIVTREFYILTTANSVNGELLYQSKLFPVKGELLIDSNDLLISSMDSTIRVGKERASISTVASMARRFSELNLAHQLSQQDHSDYYCLDGTLDPTFRGENMLIDRLSSSICALAKTCSLFTQDGNSPTMVLSSIGPKGTWLYHVEKGTYFVKLHPNSKHVFRYEGDPNIIAELTTISIDPLFLGYPYGLIFVDRIARVSKKECDMFKIQFLTNGKNKDIAKYLRTMNAHEILDSMS